MREFLKSNPWIGWIIAVLCLGFALFMAFRPAGGGAPDSIERRSQMVTIRCTETGKQWEMNRGKFERLLMTQDGMIDPSKGIPSEFAEGRLTGVLVDKDEWEDTVERINAMKRQFQD